MAALTSSNATVFREGAEVGKFSTTPVVMRFTLSSSSDTYQHPVGVKAWACIPTPTGTTDLQLVSYAASTRTFTISSVTGTSRTIDLIIWPER